MMNTTIANDSIAGYSSAINVITTYPTLLAGVIVIIVLSFIMLMLLNSRFSNWVLKQINTFLKGISFSIITIAILGGIVILVIAVPAILSIIWSWLVTFASAFVSEEGTINLDSVYKAGAIAASAIIIWSIGYIANKNKIEAPIKPSEEEETK